MAYEEMMSDIKAQLFPQREKKYKCVQDLINLPDIKEGMYCLGDGRYIKVAEVLATNFMNKEGPEQDNIISTFAGWLKVAPTRCQFKITTRLAGENRFAKNLILKRDQCDNELKKILYNAIIDHIHKETSLTANNVRYFIMFEYEEPRVLGKSQDLKYISTQINAVILQAQKYFHAMGNTFVKKHDDDLFLGEFLYELLNRKSCKSTSFLERGKRVLSDIMEIRTKAGIENPSPDTKYENIISPMGISLKTTPDAVIADETYLAYYYIPSNGYPLEVSSGWLTAAISGLVNVDIDFFYRETDRREFIKKVRQSSKFTVIKAASRTSNSKDAPEIGTAIASQDYIRDAMSDQNNQQDPYYIATFFTVAAESYEELIDLCDQVEELAEIAGITLANMVHFEWLGFITTLPFNFIHPKLYYKARRNILTNGLAGFYPFTSYELNDENGIVIGLSNNKSIVTIDPYNKDKYANANILVLGGSGKGKTYLLSLLAERTVLLNQQVFIITSEKPHEFKRVCDFLGGTFVKFSAANNANLNPFDIKPENATYEEIYGEDITESYRMKKSKFISGWFKLLFKSLKEEERIALDRAVKDMYESFGITDDNNSIFIDNGEALDDNGNPILKEMPIMSNLYEALINIRKGGGSVSNRLLSVIENFINGTYSTFNQHTNVNLDKELIVFDISSMSDTVEDATIHLALDYIWNRVKEDPITKMTVIVEEGWKYLSEGSSDEAAKHIQEIFKIIRGYGGNVILATQQIEDITASEYGKSVIDCSSIKILLGVEEGRSKSIVKALNLNPQEGESLEKFDKGGAILIAGKDHVPINIVASNLEHNLFSTDARDIALFNERIKHLIGEK